MEPDVMDQLGFPVCEKDYYVLDVIARIDITRQM
jgi:hypothetical protein